MKDRKFYSKCCNILNGDTCTIFKLVRRFTGWTKSYNKDYYRNNKLVISKYKTEWKRNDYNKNPEKHKLINRNYYHKNIHKERCLANNRVKNAYHRNHKAYKTEVLMYYGNGKLSCVCCGEKELKFLTIDHIIPRKSLKENEQKLSGFALYKNLRQNNFPKGFQTLCWNCNSGKALNKGTCPHKEQKSIEISMDWCSSGGD